MATRVGPKGQVVIEGRIRAALGVRPGARAVQRLVGDRVEIRFLPEPHTESLKGVLASHVKSRPPDPDATDKAWAAGTRRHADPPEEG